MNNYNTKFAKGDKVKIIDGLYKGRSGKITQYISGYTTKGLLDDCLSRGLECPKGMYTVKLGWLHSVYVLENQIDLV